MTIYQYRDKKDLSQRQLAGILGISQTSICRYESELENASLTTALDIERKTGYLVKAEHLPITPETRRALRQIRAQMRTLRAS